MRINLHAGHNPDGKIACGAVGFLKESTEARQVVKYLKSYLEQEGHTVYDCTVDNGTSANDVLQKIVAKCNSRTVDLDVSIHFNAGAGDQSGNGKTTGTEVWVYTAASTQKDRASRICQEIAKLGFTNRGVKISTSLYVLKNTKASALLVECCFVDDRDDAELYNAKGAKKMAKAIAQGILGKEISGSSTEKTTYAIGDRVQVSGSIYGTGNGGGGSLKKNGATMYVVGLVSASAYKYYIGLAATKGGVRQGWAEPSILTK